MSADLWRTSGDIEDLSMDYQKHRRGKSLAGKSQGKEKRNGKSGIVVEFSLANIWSTYGICN